MRDMNFLEPDPLRPPSVFTARWFRLLVVFLILLLVAVVGLPYLLEWTGPGAPQAPVVLKPSAPKTTTPAPAPPPARVVEPPAPTLPPAEKKASTTPEAPQSVAPSPPPAPEQSPPARKAPAPMRYAVQVGAFLDPANAKRLSGQLKEEKFPVQQLTVSRPGSAFQVIVVKPSGSAAKAKIAQMGLQGVETGGTVTVQPPMGLKEAVSLSERLKQEGFEVKMKTVGSTLRYHVVRVGSFPDRSSAEGARRELQSKGIAGLVVAGGR